MKTFRTGDIVEDSDGWTAVGVVVGIVEGMDLYGRTVYNVDFGDLPLALVAEELGLVERRGAYLYPRWRIVKRPWQPKPGAFYLQLVKDTPPEKLDRLVLRLVVVGRRLRAEQALHAR